MTNSLYDMKQINLEKGYIKPITKFEDFSEIIDVFKEPPYGEPLTLNDKIEEYQGYINTGLALGYYNYNNEIMGYAGLMAEVEEEHKSYFHPNIDTLDPFYVYGLATKKEYRGHGICTTLMHVVNSLAKETNTDFVYLRVNDSGSMSEHLCRRQGYDDLYQDGEVVIQNVSDNQNKISENTLPSANLRRFLIMPITEEAEDFLTVTGSILIKTQEKAKVLVKK